MSGERPLSGLRVLDLTRAYSGPFCTLLLAAFGAEVIKVEEPSKGDMARSNPPYMGVNGIHFDTPGKDDLSVSFISRNRDKKSVTLDLKSIKGKEIFYDLVKVSDILVENFSPGVMDRLGIGYEDVKKINPRIIFASISGFGQKGARKHLRAFDPVIQALSGIMTTTGFPDDPPIRVGMAIGDLVAPLFTVIGLVLSVINRDRTGAGQWIDVAMLDSIMSLLVGEHFDVFANMGLPVKTGNTYIRMAPFGFYEAKDGYITICAPLDSDASRLFEAMGEKDLVNDERFNTRGNRAINSVQLNCIIQNWTKKMFVKDLGIILDKYGIINSPVRSIEDALKDPDLKERKAVVPLKNPVLGATGEALGTGIPIVFSEMQCELGPNTAYLGQNNKEVYCGLLGYSDDELEEWQEQGII